mgnify:FL=1
MTENKEIPNEEVKLPEPQESEVQISKEEINEKIKEYWKEVETTEGFDKYKEAWDNLSYYRDLKLKLYK